MNKTARPGGVPPIARLIGAIVVLLVAASLGIPVMSGGGGGPGTVPTAPSGSSTTPNPQQSPSSNDTRATSGDRPRADAAPSQPSTRDGAGRTPAPRSPSPRPPTVEVADPLAELRELIERQVSGEMVTATAEVYRILSDDDDGSRHQRFLIAVGREGRRTLTVKVSHNFDLAPRVPVEEGDIVTIRGQFEWNDLGGVLHWTHHDPDRRREGGWIEHAGRRYE